MHLQLLYSRVLRGDVKSKSGDLSHLAKSLVIAEDQTLAAQAVVQPLTPSHAICKLKTFTICGLSTKYCEQHHPQIGHLRKRKIACYTKVRTRFILTISELYQKAFRYYAELLITEAP